jgi:hypothetical protein
MPGQIHTPVTAAAIDRLTLTASNVRGSGPGAEHAVPGGPGGLGYCFDAETSSVSQHISFCFSD